MEECIQYPPHMQEFNYKQGAYGGSRYDVLGQSQQQQRSVGAQMDMLKDSTNVLLSQMDYI